MSGEPGDSPPPRSLKIGILSQADLGTVDGETAQVYARLCDRIAASGISLVQVDLAAVVALDEMCGLAIVRYESYNALLAAVPQLTGRPLADMVAAIATPSVKAGLEAEGDNELSRRSDYAKAVGETLPRLRKAFDDLFEDGVDAILTPTTPVTAAPISNADMVVVNGRSLPSFPTYTRFTRPDSMAGLPSLSLPAGLGTSKLPVGVILSGPRWQDRRLLAIAGVIARHTEPTPPPI